MVLQYQYIASFDLFLIFLVLQIAVEVCNICYLCILVGFVVDTVMEVVVLHGLDF